MKNIYKLFGALALIMAIASCEKDFDELNTDPNSPVSVPPENLVTNVMYGVSDNYWGRGYNFEFGELMVQHMAQNEYTSDQNYIFSTSDFDGRWGALYSGSGGLYDLALAKQMIEANETMPAAQKANQLAVIDIFYSFGFQMITDLWGDVPYSQAFQPSEFPFPTYDSQAEIYSNMISKVSAAVGAINTAENGFVSGDILFGGDMAAWRDFGNALLLRMGMRISEANASLAQSTVSSALSASLPSTDIMFLFSDNQALANPFYRDTEVGARDDFRISEILANTMGANNDPRLTFYADPAPGNTVIIGMPFGLDDAGAFALKNSTSDIHVNIEDNPTSPAYLISLAEIEFYRAEAIARGWSAGDAAAAYQAGITASMNQWGVDAIATASYLAEPGVAYDATSLATELSSIATQKWIALYTNGVEAYAEWRRLDLPVLSPGPAAFETTIPTRMLYPNSEDGRNGESLAAAGANTLSTTVWWDK